MRSHSLLCGLAALSASIAWSTACSFEVRGSEPEQNQQSSFLSIADAVLRHENRTTTLPIADRRYGEATVSEQLTSLAAGEQPDWGHHEPPKEAVCCPPFWTHRTGVFGEYLLLRPRDAYVPYAVPINGPILPPPVNPVQVGPVANADPDFSSGFRAGASWAMDECTSLVATYSYFDSHTNNEIVGNAPTVIRSLVAHPGTLNAGADFLSAEADLNIRFQTVDFDYRTLWWLSDWGVSNWFVGARYAKLEQDFDSLFSQTGTVDFVNTAIDFEGVGLRLGIDAERHNCHGFLLYGRTALSLIGGEYRSDFLQGSDAAGVQVNTNFKAGRLMPIYDLELGAGWQSPCGHFRFTTGYVVNVWFSALTTDSWIRSVHQNQFVGQSDAISYDTLTFDGLTARAEYRF